jgi:hypothetical protein
VRAGRAHRLALLALLLAPSVLAAQVDTTQRADSARARRDSAMTRDAAGPGRPLQDSLRADSLLAESIRRRAERAADTIKAPLARFPVPPSTEAIVPLRWSREELLQTGALTLGELLEDVPGLTSYRTSWLPSAQQAAFLGDFRRVRLFLDGLELDGLDARANGVPDLSELSIIALDEVVVERAAGEVRVWLTSWSHRNVTAYTRTDVFTGDLNTNAFRGMFGRRFLNGALLQFTIEQGESARARRAVGAGPPTGSATGDGDLRRLTARTGWTHRGFSLDAYWLATSRTRDPTGADPAAWGLPAFSGGRRDAWLRLAYGESSRGWHAQATVGTLRTSLEPADGASQSTGAPSDSTGPALPDSSRRGVQRLLQVGHGWTRPGLTARATTFARWRASGDHASWSPGVQLSADGDWLRGVLHVERLGRDSSLRLDASTRLALRPWLITSIAISSLRPDDDSLRRRERTTRVETALRLGGTWLAGGLIRQVMDSGPRTVTLPTLLSPVRADSAPLLLGQASTAVTFSARTPLYKALRLELHGMRWNGGREYRPQTHLRATLILQSEWRSRFPKGDFGINARWMHEYRSGVAFLSPDTPASPFRQTAAFNVGTALLEIRIQQATIFYQFRNVYGAQYAQVPGVPMPPPHQLYGVRWEWFN